LVISGILQLRPVDLISDLRTDANFGGFDNQPFLRQLATQRMEGETPAAPKAQGFESVSFDDKLRLYYCEVPPQQSP